MCIEPDPTQPPSPSVGDLFFAEVFDPVNRADPYELYARMRAQSPVLDAGNQLWFTFDYELANTLLRAKNVSSDERKSAFFRETAIHDERLQRFAEQEPLMLFMDPPDHTRLRRLVASAFTPRRVEQLVPRIQELTDQLIDAMPDSGVFDLVPALAHPLPVAVICELLGVPRSDEPIFMEWSNDLARGIDPSALRSEADELAITNAQEALDLYTRDLLDRRRADPGDDLLSSLLEVRDGEDRLTEDELVNLVILLLIAGHETTVNLIGNGAVALMRHPEQLQRWRVDPSLDKSAVDELLRYDSPVQMGMRVLLEPWELGPNYNNTMVPAGAQVLTLLGAANRDPAMFDNPEVLDLSRDNAARNMSFGGGIHHCLGMALARVEGQIALGSLVRRFGRLELAAEPEVRARFVLRGFESIMVDVSVD